MFELRFACWSGADSDSEASGAALEARLAAARAAAATADQDEARAEAAAARALADAGAKVDARRRHLALTQKASDGDDAEVLESAEALLRAALAGTARIRDEGHRAVAAARAASEAAAAAVRAATGDITHEAAARATLLAASASMSPASSSSSVAAPVSATAATAESASQARRPLVVCIVEPGIWKATGWTPGEELKALANLSSKLFADASGAASVDFASELTSEADRRKLTHDPKALPRILELIAAARKDAASSGGSVHTATQSGSVSSSHATPPGTVSLRATPPGSTSSPRGSN